MLSDKSLRLVTDPAKVAPEYLLAALRFPEARVFIEEHATGSSFSMKNIPQEVKQLDAISALPAAYLRLAFSGTL